MKKYLSVDIYKIIFNTFDMSKGFIISTGITVLFFGGILGNFYYQNQIDKPESKQEALSVVSEPTITPINSPTITQTVVSQPTPTNDPDPVIDCRFNFLGTQRMKLSECKVSFECEINDKWYIYTSKDKCSSDQESYWRNSTNNNYIAPTSAVTPYQYKAAPTILPLNTPTQIPQSTESREERVSVCKAYVRNKYKPQIDRCNRLSTGAGTYDSTERQVCLSNVAKLQQIDLETCDSL